MEPTDRDRIILVGLIFAVLLSQVLLYPGIIDLVGALGATTELDASMWFLASEFLGYIVFVGVWGILSDRTGKRRRFIVIGAVGGAIGYAIIPLLAIGWAVSFDLLVALRFVQGAFTIGAFSVAIAMLMDLPGGHGRNMGAAGIAIGLGTGLGAPIGGVLTEIDPLAPLFVASGLLFVVGGATAFASDRAPAAAASIMATLEGMIHTPSLVIPYTFGMIDRLTAGFFALVGTVYFRTDPAAGGLGLSAAETGVMLSLFFFTFAVFQYPLGKLSDRIGRTIPIVIGSVLYGFGVIAVGVAPSVITVGAAMVAVGLLGALMAPATMALVTDLAPVTDRATAMGGFNLCGSVGFLLGFLVGGTVAKYFGFTTAFLVAGGLEILIALVALPVLLRLRDRTVH